MFLSKFNNFGLFSDIFYTVYDNSYIVRTEDSISIKVELPGFKKENITLQCSGKNLDLYAKRNEDNSKIYSNTWVLEDNINTSKITAKLDCGVLTIKLPFLAEKNSTNIEIE